MGKQIKWKNGIVSIHCWRRSFMPDIYLGRCWIQDVRVLSNFVQPVLVPSFMPENGVHCDYLGWNETLWYLLNDWVWIQAMHNCKCSSHVQWDPRAPPDFSTAHIWNLLPDNKSYLILEARAEIEEGIRSNIAPRPALCAFFLEEHYFFVWCSILF